MRILLVEDHDDTRLATEACLAQQGATVTVMASAQQALVALSKERFDVVVTDYGMPQHNGRWLLDRVGELATPVPPVIVVTGYSDREVEDLRRAPFARVVRKPVDFDQLCDELLAIVREHRQP